MFKSRGMTAAVSAIAHLLGQFKRLSKLCKPCYCNMELFRELNISWCYPHLFFVIVAL